MATNETKRIPAITAEVLDDAAKLVLTFGDGRTLILGALECSEAVREQAMMHGFKQKLVDAAAISRNPDTGRSATLDDKYNAVRTVYDRLLAGQWNATRGDGTGSGGLLYRALCELYPNKSAEAVRTYHDGLTKEQQAAMRLNPKVAPIIARLRDERAPKAKGIDSDALLAGLGE